MIKFDGKKERTLKELAVLNSTYGEIARFIIWGDSEPRDVSDWIFHCDNSTKLLN